MNIEQMASESALTGAVIVVAALLLLLVLKLGLRVVPQSNVYVVERFGRFQRVLSPGLNLIVPLLDVVRHKVSILERQLDEMRVSVITKDNVEIDLATRVFMRIAHAEKAMYRIEDVEGAVRTAGIGLVRNASGKLELDDIQAGRDVIATDVKKNLSQSADEWGVAITRVEIVDVVVDEATKDAQRRQVLAERLRRATVMEADGEREAIELKAKGDKRSVELAAEAALYQAKKEADAQRINADAQAYEVEKIAKAQAAEIMAVGHAMKEHGENAARFEVAKRQVEAIARLASAPGSRVVVLPTKAVEALGAVEALRALIEPQSTNGGTAR